MKLERKTIRWLVLGILAIILIYPWQSTVAPAVRIQVLDEAGEPARGVIVKQDWGHFNLNSDGHEYARTDDNGYVAFPERYVRGSLLRRVLMPAWDLLSHGGIGPRGSIWAHGEDPKVWTTANHTIKLQAPSQMRLQKWGTPIYP
jgi:hypothetical protein